jgi:hypothetical protein
MEIRDVESSDLPSGTQVSRGKILANFNIAEVQKTVEGELVTSYVYDQIELPETTSDVDVLELVAQASTYKWKESRTLAVSQIIVTTASGRRFDGGEVSQDRMGRAILGLQAGETQPWILADNQPGELPVDVTKEEFLEALRLAGKAQTAVWSQ